MSSWLQQFHFLQPWWLLALAGLPLLCWLGLRRSTAQQELSRLVDAKLLPHLLHGHANNRSLPVGLFALAWVLCTLALAGPSWNRVEQPLYANRPAQVVAISLSQHMLSRDTAPSRLDRARYKAHDLLSSNRDGLNALIGYAGETFVVAPLTSDASSLSDLLDAMAPDTMPVDGNNAAAAIKQGVQLIHDAKADGGSLVLITDQADAQADAAAAKALAAGVHVSVLGVGTRLGGPVPLSEGGFLHDANGHMVLASRDDGALTALARAGGGRYVPMTSNQQDIDALHAQLRTAPTATAQAGQTGDEWQDRGPWLLLLLLPIVALAFRRGWLLLLLLVFLPALPRTAAAGTWQNLWQRPDQQAAQALREGDPVRAQKLARDPAWRGAAAYRADDYAAAAVALQQASGSDAAYNRGNALAKSQRYQEAIKAYDQALKRNPQNADAKANRKAVEDWLQQQKKPPSKQQKQQGHDGDKQQPSQDGKQGKSNESDAQQKSAKNDAGSTGQNKQAGKSAQDDQSDKNDSAGDHSSKNQAGDKPTPQTAEQQAAQQAQTRQAQQALKKQMDNALAGKPGKPANQPAPHQLGAMAKDDPQSKLPADIQHALQRVPDDPGALLRRKFELEYQQRHGGAADEDGQP
ncbi:MAG: tetratricopeptide repeat protein [Rhodanobacter sp.]